ncbi:MAG: acyl-CoA dehydrogenase family protein [Armatimonadetes bacterium]|nr:acyl-CoA dehydrogenase family protein [Armatimonadota bacterium]
MGAVGNIAALQQAVADAGAGWAVPALQAYGRAIATADARADAVAANEHPPRHRPFDARGHRIDAVVFHPGWHRLLGQLRAAGGVSGPWRDAQPGRWTAWAALFYLHGQVEQGTLCPATMTQAAIPILQREPGLWSLLGSQLLCLDDDPQDAPLTRKRAVWIGMGMTEKQGGSDVRANTTTAWPVQGQGRGAVYRLRGHKWFYSAPTSDAHLVSARIAGEDGIGCFFVPRWWMDGTRNAVRLQRLKDKMGNRSNASGEVEFEDAWGILIGQPERGLAVPAGIAAGDGQPFAVRAIGDVVDSLADTAEPTHQASVGGLPEVDLVVAGGGQMGAVGAEGQGGDWNGHGVAFGNDSDGATIEDGGPVFGRVLAVVAGALTDPACDQVDRLLWKRVEPVGHPRFGVVGQQLEQVGAFRISGHQRDSLAGGTALGERRIGDHVVLRLSLASVVAGDAVLDEDRGDVAQK